MKTAFLIPLLIVAALPGCKGAAEVVSSLPPGTQMQSSTFGVKVAPSSVDGTPFVIGSHSTIFTTAQPENAPNLNRFEGRAPLISTKSTVATGAVGEQLEKAGGPAALEILIGKPPGLNIKDKIKVHKPTFDDPPDPRMPRPLSGLGPMKPWPDALEYERHAILQRRLGGWAIDPDREMRAPSPENETARPSHETVPHPRTDAMRHNEGDHAGGSQPPLNAND